ncbi:MAG: hypothetical protein ACTSQE_12615 [Candidatus Heimdallarchaeaceae archaeon]
MKNLEIKTIEHKGIKVTVKIDYDNKEISLVEKRGRSYENKKWQFTNRGVNFVKSWKDILRAMDNAIGYGNEQLTEFIEEQTNQKVEKMMELDNLAKDIGF